MLRHLFNRQEGIPWPPTRWQDVQRKYLEWAAWYSGDPKRLAHVYQQLAFTPSPKGRFWANNTREKKLTMLHVPIAGDISTTSADLLFSEQPDLEIPEAKQEDAPADAINCQERLNEIIEQNNAYSALVEAAESSSALGGTYLKVEWDNSYKPFPIIRVAQADAAVPKFRYGFLEEVTFYKTIETSNNNNEVWRLLEKHYIARGPGDELYPGPEGRGVIKNELWKGNESDLGVQKPLTAHSYTADKQELVDTGIDDIVCRYIPNMLPNKKFRDKDIGNSDYQGIEGLMDSLDEVFTNWLRDIRLSKARITVPEHWLEQAEDLQGRPKMKFSEDKAIFAGMNMGPAGSESGGADMFQPDIRSQKFKETSLELLDRIISSAGYSPQSFGLKIDGRAESGTALKARERKSMKTKEKKERYFRSPLEDILEICLKIDRTHFPDQADSYEVYRPRVKFADSFTVDIGEKADALQKLERAEAASIEAKVRELHPDWSDTEVRDEIRRIKEEKGIAVDEPDLRA